MASVVFPAIGTGNLGFPKDLVARIMLTELQEFTSTNLQEVTVIVHPSDKESIEVSVKTRFKSHKITSQVSHLIQYNQDNVLLLFKRQTILIM